jgi:CBS domain-containing protein
MKVSDIMTSEGLATATLDTTLAEIAARMRDENVGAIPIVDEDDKLAGIITDRDIVVRGIAEGEDPDKCTAEDIIGEKLHTIHPHADIEEAAELMARHQIRRLPVVENSIIVGMISLGDIAVKSEEDEASVALEDISEGVRETAGARDESGDVETDNLREAREPVSAGENLGSTSRTGSVESTFSVAGQASEDLEDDDLVSERGSSGRQLGGSRSSTSLAGRLRNWSRSQQTVVHEAEELEGEDAEDVISSTLVEGRERTNQQQASPNRIVNEQERSSRTSEITRPSAKSQGAKPVNKVSNRVPLKPARTEVKAQSGGNRARAEEGKKGKVTTMKSSGRTNARSKSKRKAS